MGIETAGVVAAWIAGSTGLTITTLGAYYAATAVVFIGMVAVGGMALKSLMPEMSTDNSAGTALQTRKSNTNPLPLVYGEKKLAGNIIFETTNGSNNEDYWAISVLTEGQLSDALEVYANEDIITKADGTWEFRGKYTQVVVQNIGSSGSTLSQLDFIPSETGDKVLGESIFGTIPLVESSSYVGTDVGNLTDGDDTTGWKPDVQISSFFTVRVWEDEYIILSENVLNAITKLNVLLPKPTYSTTTGGETGFETGIHNYSIFTLQYSDDGINWVDASNEYDTRVLYPKAYPNSYNWLEIENTEGATEHLHWRIYFSEGAIKDKNTLYEIDIETTEFLEQSLPANLSVMAIHQKYVSAGLAHIQLDTVAAVIQGKAVRRLTSSTVLTTEKSYSNNPVEHLIDILLNYMNVSENKIDLNAFYNAKVFCDNNDLTCNVAFIEQQQLESSIKTILATFRGHLTYSEGLYYLVYDAPAQSIITLTDADILNDSFSASTASSEDIGNLVTTKFIEPLDGSQADKVSRLDVAISRIDGREVELVQDVVAVTNEAQALKLGSLYLNELRYTEDNEGNRVEKEPLTISFSTTYKFAHLQIGDIITLDLNVLNYGKMFKILSVETDQSGAYTFECREYASLHYKYAYTDEDILI